jgi:hypothetical protein
MATRKRRVQVVLSDSEYEKFQKYAELKGIAMSEILRDYIKNL